MEWRFGRVVLCLQILLHHWLAYGLIRSFWISLWLRELGEGFIVIRPIEIRAMLPDVTCHIVKAVGVGWEGLDWSSSRESIFGRIPVRKFSLIDVSLPFIPGLWVITPAEELFVESATGCPFPFSLGGQPLSCPLTEGDRVFMSHAYNGVIHAVGNT